MKYPQLASIKECTGCFSCIEACPTLSLKKSINNEGHFFYQFKKDTCIQCGKCEKACPVISKTKYSKSGISSFNAVWAKDTKLREKSASGGAFAAIANYVIDNNGIVFGATNLEFGNVAHIYIDNINDIYKLQGSKYTSSDVSGCYKQVLKFLKEDRFVLFSGTGCQVAGLLTFLQNKYYKGRLLTVDLICGGIPSRFLIDKFIENEPYRVEKILSFRTKEEGWKSSGFLYNMKIEDVDGKIHNYKGVRNLITDGFCSELTNRNSCYNCNFNGENRLSDYTIGDLWGDNMYVHEHKMGVSLLIAHNDDSQFLLNEDLKNYLVVNLCDKNRAIKYNPRIMKGRSYKKYMPERLFMVYIFSHFSYKTIKKIYAYDFSKYSVWTIYKAFRFLIDKLFK